MEEKNAMLEKSNMIHAFVYDGSLLEEITEKRFEKTIKDVTRDLGGKPTNRKQRRKFMKKATKEYNKRSFVKCRQKDLFR